MFKKGKYLKNLGKIWVNPFCGKKEEDHTDDSKWVRPVTQDTPIDICKIPFIYFLASPPVQNKSLEEKKFEDLKTNPYLSKLKAPLPLQASIKELTKEALKFKSLSKEKELKSVVKSKWDK